MRSLLVVVYIFFFGVSSQAVSPNCSDVALRILGNDFEMTSMGIKPKKNAAITSFDSTKIKSGNGEVKFSATSGLDGKIIYRNGRVVSLIAGDSVAHVYDLNEDCSLEQIRLLGDKYVTYDKKFCVQLAETASLLDDEKARQCADFLTKVSEVLKKRSKEIAPRIFSMASSPLSEDISLKAYTGMVSSCTLFSAIYSPAQLATKDSDKVSLDKFFDKFMEIYRPTPKSSSEKSQGVR